MNFTISGRVISGLVVPYNKTNNRAEGGPRRFARGAFSGRQPSVALIGSIEDRSGAKPQRIELRFGTSTALTDGPDGLRGSFRINAGEIGDEFLAMVRDGYYQSLAPEWITHDARRVNGIHVISRATVTMVRPAGDSPYEPDAIEGGGMTDRVAAIIGQHRLPMASPALARLGRF